jgi:hypothetical protein
LAAGQFFVSLSRANIDSSSVVSKLPFRIALAFQKIAPGDSNSEQKMTGLYQSPWRGSSPFMIKNQKGCVPYAARKESDEK